MATVERHLGSMHAYAYACVLACALVGVARVHADAPAPVVEDAPAPDVVDTEAPILGVQTTAEQTYASEHDIDPTTSASVVRLRDRTAAGEGMRDVLPEVPGLRVLAASSEGQYASVRIRGADLAHTTYMIGDVPVSGADTGGFDIGALPIRLFERVEVYRGGAPAWYADGAIGGVVRFVPATLIGNRFGASLGAGSFRAVNGEVEGSVSHRGFSLFTNVGMAGAKNDYAFSNDNGTLLDPRDDTTERRQNAQYLREHAFVYARQVHGGLTLDVVYFGFATQRGDPSPGDRQALHTRAQLMRNFASASLTYEGEVREHRYRLQALAAYTRERLDYQDPNREIGLSADDARVRTTAIHGRLAATIDLVRWLAFSGIATARRDDVDQHDAIDLDQVPPAHRTTVTTTAELRAHGRIGGVRGELRGSVQYRTAQLDIPYSSVDGLELNDTRYTSGTYRAGFALAPAPFITLNGSVYSGARLPTLLETFGNRSNILPAPTLRPETSLGFDGGVTVCADVGPLTVSAELRAFRNEIDDLIRITMTSQRTARASNVESGLFRGLESVLDVRLAGHARIEGNVTYTRATSEGGFDVPLSPRLTAHATATANTGALGRVFDDVAVHFGVTHLGKSFNDAANLVRFPTRTWLEAGARVFVLDRRLQLAVTVRDLADRGGRDFLGYVLPGRRVAATLAYEQEFP